MQWRRRRLPSAHTGTSGSKSVAVRALFASPWQHNGLHGLADALSCSDQEPNWIVLAATSPSLLVRSCSLDRRVKNKSSLMPLRA